MKQKLGRPRSESNPLSPCCSAATHKKGKVGERKRYQCTCCQKAFAWPPRIKTEVSRKTPKVILGEGNPHSRLTNAKVLEILSRKSAGENGPQIAKNIDAPYPTVYGVLSGRTWSWFTGIHPPR